MDGQADLSYEFDKLRRVVNDRFETDRVIPTWLPLIGVILVGIGAVLFILTFIPFMLAGLSPSQPVQPPLSAFLLFFTGLAFLLVAIIIGGLIMLYLVYLWLQRINDHFDRVRGLIRNLIYILENTGFRDDARRIDEELRELEYKMGGERSPILWAILVFLVGILIWYVLHMVNESLRKIGKGEYEVMKRLDVLAKNLGIEGFKYDISKIEKVPRRDTVLYIILSIITFGIFTVYWAYVATVDINNHFKIHMEYEEEILNIVEELIRKRVESKK